MTSTLGVMDQEFESRSPSVQSATTTSFSFPSRLIDNLYLFSTELACTRIDPRTTAHRLPLSFTGKRPKCTLSDMETYTLQQLPPAYRRISIAYFDNVTNSAGIKKELVRSALMEGPEGDAARRRMDFAFVEGDVVSVVPLFMRLLFLLLPFAIARRKERRMRGRIGVGRRRGES